ncbi:MAG: YciI family protein [Gaiellaceae bacterium]
MKYILMFISDDANWDPRTPETQQAYQRVDEWFGEHSGSGKIIGGEELTGTDTATTVRSRNGTITVTDGPYAESKEAIGGYAIVDVKDLDEAIAMAKTWPVLTAIEIRPLVEHPS